MTLGPQFYPRHESVSSNISLRKDVPLYHGTGGDIEGGVVRPAERQLFGPGAYATEEVRSAEHYARISASEQGRLFGMVYEVSPVSDDAQIVGSEGGKAVVTDPAGLRTKRAVSFPPVNDYSEEHKALAEERKAQAETVDRITEFFR
jgi:hypothetical protein